MAKKNKTLEEDTRLQTMMQAIMLGIKPTDYAEFYKMILGEYADDDFPAKTDETHPADTPTSRETVKSRPRDLKDASEKTLILRVKMQDVTKPPVWRELKVPADFTFYQLHMAIQAAFGFENAHLWRFRSKSNDRSLQISMAFNPNDPYGFEPNYTHDARKTPITNFLAEKGQKLMYVYDFGDDWRFDISVVNITARDGDVAECTRWKCDVQPLEDTGGIWDYMVIRQAWDERDTMTDDQKVDFIFSHGLEKFDQFEEIISHTLFNIETVNSALAKIPR